MILVVPMDPQFLPEAGFVIAGLFAGAAAIHFLLTRQRRNAMRAVAAVVACTALVFALAKTLHNPPKPPVLRPAAENSMSLVLGDVVLRVTPSDRYVLTVAGERFLELDLRDSGLAVSCVAGADNRASTGITQNTFPFRWADVRPSSPDSHTLLVQENGRDIFKVDYSEPQRIEVMGQFFQRRSAQKALVSFQDGIHWNGGRVPAGTVVDLRSQGQGMIDFGPSGSIQVRPG